MSTLAEVVRRHGPAYLERHGPSVLPSHVRAIRSIGSCRTAALGGHIGHCLACKKEHLLYHSCRHRACPQCGTIQTTRWLDGQRELLLPVPYFHVVFTLPSELRRVVRSNQKALLPVLFRAAYESLAELCLDPHFLGAQIGALAVLHTWTRTLEWHPHVHMLVPGGGLAVDGATWVPVPRRRRRYLVPGAAGSTHRATLKRIQLLLMKRVAARTVPTPPAESRHLRCPHCGEQALALGRRLTAAECHARVESSRQPIEAPAPVKARAPPPTRGQHDMRAA